MSEFESLPWDMPCMLREVIKVPKYNIGSAVGTTHGCDRPRNPKGLFGGRARPSTLEASVRLLSILQEDALRWASVPWSSMQTRILTEFDAQIAYRNRVDDAKAEHGDLERQYATWSFLNGLTLGLWGVVISSPPVPGFVLVESPPEHLFTCIFDGPKHLQPRVHLIREGLGALIDAGYLEARGSGENEILLPTPAFAQSLIDNGFVVFDR